jgi:hypothetical protein
MNLSVLNQLAVLPRLSGQELRERYCQLYGVDTAPNSNRQYLVRLIAYRLQELASKRSLSETAEVQMRLLLEDSGLSPETGKPAKGLGGRDRRTVQVKVGTPLYTTYRGQTYCAVPLPHGMFEFEGRAYNSLSRIAREITHTNRSGPEFFGLTSGTASHPAKRKQ